MKIFAIDTTGLAASVAIVEEGKTIAEFATNFKKTHSETLMPMIHNVFKSVDMDMDEIDYIACSSGPGSFTGLRIGVAAAKGLAFGKNKKIVPVPTLDAMAYNIFMTDCIIAPIMDARRNQAYTAFYSWHNGIFTKMINAEALDIYEIIWRLKEYKRKIIFLGDGVPVYKDIIAESGLEYSFAPEHLNVQRASSIGSLAIKLAKEGNIVSSYDFVPEYLRKSQAERELEERTKAEEKLNI